MNTEKLKIVAEACGYTVRDLGSGYTAVFVYDGKDNMIGAIPRGESNRLGGDFDPLTDYNQAVACLDARFDKNWRLDRLKGGFGVRSHIGKAVGPTFGEAAVAAILASVEDDDSYRKPSDGAKGE